MLMFLMRKSCKLGGLKGLLLGGTASAAALLSGCNDRVAGGTVFEILGQNSRNAQAGAALSTIGSNMAASGIAQEGRSQVNIYNNYPRMVARAPIVVERGENRNNYLCNLSKNQRIKFQTNIQVAKGDKAKFFIEDPEGNKLCEGESLFSEPGLDAYIEYDPSPLKDRINPGTYVWHLAIGQEGNERIRSGQIQFTK